MSKTKTVLEQKCVGCGGKPDGFTLDGEPICERCAIDFAKDDDRAGNPMKVEKIEFEPKTKGKRGKVIASKYTRDGSFPKRGKSLPLIYTVGELKRVLAQLPDKLPIRSSWSEPIRPVWFNIGMDDEHLAFREPDEE